MIDKSLCKHPIKLLTTKKVINITKVKTPYQVGKVKK